MRGPKGRERLAVFAKILVAIAIGIVAIVLVAGVSTLFVEGPEGAHLVQPA